MVKIISKIIYDGSSSKNATYYFKSTIKGDRFLVKFVRYFFKVHKAKTNNSFFECCMCPFTIARSL